MDREGPLPDVADESRPGRLGLLASGEGVITGTVVCAAVIAAVAGHATSTSQLVVAMVGTIFVYWLAHLHAHAIGRAVRDQHHPWLALRWAFAHTWVIAAVSLLPLGILLLAELAGAELLTAAWIALYATIALLAIYSYAAGRRGGLGLFGSLVCSVAGASLGVLVAVLKAVAIH